MVLFVHELKHFPPVCHCGFQGIPALNMFFCQGGGGNSIGLKAQMCTGLALTAFEGHLGYLIIS
jgi:hypothetical protein